MNNNFEELFKNKFSDYRPKVPKTIWVKISSAIKTIVLKRIVTILFVSTIIVSAAVLMFFNKLNINDESIQKTQNSVYQIKNTRNSVNVVDYQKNVNEKTKLPDIKKNENVIYVSIDNTINTNEEKINENDDSNVDSNLFVSFNLSQHKGCCPLKIVLSDDSKIQDIKWEINGKEYINKSKFVVNLDTVGIYPVVLTRIKDGKKYKFVDSVVVFDSPKANFIIPAEIVAREQVLFDNDCEGNLNYQWYINNKVVSNAQDLIYNFNESGIKNVMLIVQNENQCYDTIIKSISVENQDKYIVFPTAFSPNIYGPSSGYYNADSKISNTIFRPYVFDKGVFEYELKIYNRFGKIIFESNELNRGWDGYFNNNLVPVDVYVYVAKGKFDDGETFSQHGSVTVVYKK